MTSLIKDQSQFQLTPERLAHSLAEISSKLKGRVSAAYTFGSASTGDFSNSSDIDLILVVADSDTPFIQRGYQFKDLFAVYPKLDVLVYTESELAQQLADSSLGFWKSVRLSMKQIL